MEIVTKLCLTSLVTYLGLSKCKNVKKLNFKESKKRMYSIINIFEHPLVHINELMNIHVLSIMHINELMFC